MRMLLIGFSIAAFSLTAWCEPQRIEPKLVGKPLEAQGLKTVNSSIVLETSKSAREDLKSIMAQVKAANSRQQQLGAKTALNPRATASDAGVAANPCTGQNVASWRICIDRVQAKLAGMPMENGERAEIDQQMDALQQDLDSMSEMGEMQSLKLQMAMDRLSKMQTTLSNVMKKASDTSSSVIQNIK